MKKILFNAFCVAALTAHSALIDFNGGSELSNDFAGFSDFSQSGTGGLDNSGSVTLTGNSQLAVYQTGFDASALSNDSFSVYFQYVGVGSRASTGGRPLSVGFTSAANDTYDTSATSTGTDLRATFQAGNLDTDNSLAIFNNGGSVDVSSSNISLSDGSWYFLELRVGGVTGGDFTGVQAELFSSDATGNLGTSLKILDNSGGGGYTITSALAADTDAYGFIGGQNPANRGASVGDNFTTVIPEPSTIALMGLALGAAAVMRRKK